MKNFVKTFNTMEEYIIKGFMANNERMSMTIQAECKADAMMLSRGLLYTTSCIYVVVFQKDSDFRIEYTK